MEQKTEASQALDVKSWKDRMGKGSPESHIKFAMQDEIDDLRAALKAQPAPTEAQTGITPDPAHVVALALSGALPDAQAGQILSAAYGPAPAEAAQGEHSARLDAAQDVLAERRRQIEVEGWTPARDDRYNDCQLAAAAATYALCTKPDELKVCGITAWPWSAGWWRPTSYRRNLVKAGALIIAEIERIDRARASAETGGVKS